MAVRGPGVSEKAHIQPSFDIDVSSSLVMYTHIYLDTHYSTLYAVGFAKSYRTCLPISSYWALCMLDPP